VVSTNVAGSGIGAENGGSAISIVKDSDALSRTERPVRVAEDCADCIKAATANLPRIVRDPTKSAAIAAVNNGMRGVDSKGPNAWSFANAYHSGVNEKWTGNSDLLPPGVDIPQPSIKSGLAVRFVSTPENVNTSPGFPCCNGLDSSMAIGHAFVLATATNDTVVSVTTTVQSLCRRRLAARGENGFDREGQRTILAMRG
jgi:hypothetical protein